MPLEKLCEGVLTTMPQNTIFALPAKKVTLFTNTAAPTLQVSNDPAFATSVAVTLTDGAAVVAAGFIRATAVGGALVTLKRD